jgi:FkbM family methyltransferase
MPTATETSIGQVRKLETLRAGLDSTVASLGSVRAEIVALTDRYKQENGLPVTAEIFAEHIQGGGVPGGHLVIGKVSPDGSRQTPWMPSTRESSSIALRHTDVVADIGAYVGTYALTAARFPVCKVVAYEPTPSTFQILSRTRLPNLKLVHAAVVGDGSEFARLFISSGIGASNRIARDHTEYSISVPAVSYVEAVSGATVVKIDVEGGEYDYPIVQPSLRAVIIDFHPAPGQWQENAERIVEELHDNGFQPVVKPRFDASGWDRAGSWIREVPELEEVYEPMLAGRECCGCGVSITAQGKGLCGECWSGWFPRHRYGYQPA